jgi:hypothetical protein
MLYLNLLVEMFNRYITRIYFSHFEPPGVSDRMCSVNLDA